MKKGKNKTRRLILTSGLSWRFLLSIARSHKVLKLEPTLEEYICGIAAQPLGGMLWIFLLFLFFIISFIAMQEPAMLIIMMAMIYFLITLIMIIHNGFNTSLTVIETMKMAYLHIRKTLFIRR